MPNAKSQLVSIPPEWPLALGIWLLASRFSLYYLFSQKPNAKGQKPVRLNPTLQIRSIPTKAIELDPKYTAACLNPTLQIRSIPTDGR